MALQSLLVVLLAVPALVSAAAPNLRKLQSTGTANRTSPANQTVRILHISDTHSMHRTIESEDYRLPPADILIHTGDVSNNGYEEEFKDFNAWLGELKSRYPHIFVIAGNHDWMGIVGAVRDRKAPPEVALQAGLMKQKFSNAVMLDHEAAEVLGLRIFGSSWCPWFEYAAPGDRMGWGDEHRRIWRAWQNTATSEHGSIDRYAEIPAGLDILLTHGPPRGIFDRTLTSGQWGSSQSLLTAIETKKPKLHLFGHVHEQRGQWMKKEDGQYDGGVEYQPNELSPMTFTSGEQPPAQDYPVRVVSNNAMANNQQVDAEVGHASDPFHIVGPARLITATWHAKGWKFDAQAV